MFASFIPAQRRAEDAVEGWGSVYGALAGAAGGVGPAATLSASFSTFPLNPGQQRGMLTQMICQCLSQGKLLPLGLMGAITIELELGDLHHCFALETPRVDIAWTMIQPEILCDTLQSTQVFLTLTPRLC